MVEPVKSFWERTFDDPQAAKYGCIGSLVVGLACVVGAGVLVGQCSADNQQEIAQQQRAAAAGQVKADEQAAEAKAKGLNCLSGWDGSEPDVVEQVKGRIRDPGSFEHIETRMTREKNGAHHLIMRFRSRNGFGGMTEGLATATVLNSGGPCVARVMSVNG